MMTANTQSRVEVRPVEAHDTSRVIEFVREGFEVVARRPPDAMRPLFEYRWATSIDKPNLGFALYSRNEIVGFLGAVYAERVLAGRVLKTCNLSTWYVRDDFRNAGMKLLYSVMAQVDYTVTNFTASPAVGKVMEAVGFKTLDHCKLVYLPWHYLPKMFGSKLAILTTPKEIAELLDGEERQFFRDHATCHLRHYVFYDNTGYSYLILKRRLFPGEAAFEKSNITKLRVMWYPCMEVLYLGNVCVATRNWSSIVGTILRKDRVFAVVVPERLLGQEPPPGGRFDHRNYILPRGPTPGVVDSLYSELALLPWTC